MKRIAAALCEAFAAWVTPASAQEQAGFDPAVESAIAQVPRIVVWRRDPDELAELSYEEMRTARVVAQHLRSLRMEVRTSVRRLVLLASCCPGAAGAGA